MIWKKTALISLLISLVLISGLVSYSAGHTLGHQSGYDNGYVQGVKDGVGTGWNIRDPTYIEAKNFLKTDKTEETDYSDMSHECHYISAAFKNNAFMAGYRCAYVIMVFQDNHSHAIVAFNTTDEGMIFVEPQSDGIVRLAIGEKYECLQWLGNITDYAVMW